MQQGTEVTGVSRFFMPTGFRTVGNTCAGIADRSLGGMGGSDVYIDDAMGGDGRRCSP